MGSTGCNDDTMACWLDDSMLDWSPLDGVGAGDGSSDGPNPEHGQQGLW